MSKPHPRPRLTDQERRERNRKTRHKRRYGTPEQREHLLKLERERQATFRSKNRDWCREQAFQYRHGLQRRHVLRLARERMAKYRDRQEIARQILLRFEINVPPMIARAALKAFIRQLSEGGV